MSSNQKLFESFDLGGIALQNKAVMSPMTRNRSTADHVPVSELMATYYSQRASAGLIITEGTAPSANGAGYARIPGIYNQAQIDAWKPITEAVHEKGGKIFMQLMHTGRVSHPLNMPAGTQVVGPSPKVPAGTQMYTDQEGMKEMPVPVEMSQADINQAIEEFVTAAKNAIAAGFDGVELHGANGYLIEQFINPGANERTDEYGGSHENRARFAIQVAEATVAAIGKEKVGIRFSPGGAFNDCLPFEGQEETYIYLAKKMKEIGLTYIHLVDHSAMGAPEVPRTLKAALRDAFGGTVIISGGYDFERANKDLEDGLGHLVAFGRPFLANPDLLERFKQGAALNQPNFDTFYTPGAVGYTDYPTL